MRLTDSITQHTKTVFKKKPCSHIFVSRWAGIMIPRIGMVVQMTETFSQDMFRLVVTALHAGYVQLLEQFAITYVHALYLTQGIGLPRRGKEIIFCEILEL